jgi:hypothetical protein
MTMNETEQAMVGNALWVTDLLDPGGYQLSFQTPTDAPEDTEFPD